MGSIAIPEAEGRNALIGQNYVVYSLRLDEGRTNSQPTTWINVLERGIPPGNNITQRKGNGCHAHNKRCSLQLLFFTTLYKIPTVPLKNLWGL